MMELMQQNKGFDPITLILETQREMDTFKSMVLHIKKSTEKDADYEMACAIIDKLRSFRGD